MPATQKNEHKILEDLMRMADGAFSTVAGFRSEFTDSCKEQLERLRGGGNSEELELIKSMQVKILEQQQEILKRLDALEGKK